MIRSSITICTFMAFSKAFMSFDVNLSLTAGGPFKSTELLAFKIYQTAFSNFEYGKGQAEAVVLFIIVAIISLVQVTVSRRKEVTHNEREKDKNDRSDFSCSTGVGGTVRYAVLPGNLEQLKESSEFVANPLAGRGFKFETTEMPLKP